MNGLLRLALALLPHGMRDRYREQWLADLRDAPEAGLRPAGIAWGALAFALTAPRPGPSISLDPARMRRIAFALALAGALIGLTWYPGFEYGADSSAWTAYGRFVVDAVVLVVQVLGPVAAVVLISAAGPMRRGERVSVWLLAIAAAAPLAPPLLAAALPVDVVLVRHLYLHPGALGYAAAAVLVVVALVLRRPRVGHGRPHPAAIAAATASVGALAMVGYLLAAGIWVGREQLVVDAPVGSPVYVEWLRLKTDYETEVTAVLVASAVAGLLLVAAVAVAGLLHRAIDLRTATLAAASLVVWGYVLLTQYLALGVSTSALAAASPTVLSLLRLAVVVAVFAAVDGVRLPRRVRPATA